MSQKSPQSPFEFLLVVLEEEEEGDTATDDQQPQSEEIEDQQEEVETADNSLLLDLSSRAETTSSEHNSTMNTDSSSSSSSSSSDKQAGEEDAMNSEPEDCIQQQSPMRSVFALKPRSLTMKGIAFAPDLPAKKRPFDDSVEEDDSQTKKMKEDDEKTQNDTHDDDDDDDDEPSNEEDIDEVAIMKGILDYHSKNGEYPFANSSALQDFIENSLQGSVNPQQLGNRIPELREKYMKIQEKEVLGPHDQEAFELSKKIWGNESENADDLNEFDEDKKGSGVGDQQHDLSTYPFLKESLQFLKNSNALAPVVTESTLEASLGLIGDSKAKELDEQWRKLKVDELELFAKQMDLIVEQTKLVLEAVKSSSLQ